MKIGQKNRAFNWCFAAILLKEEEALLDSVVKVVDLMACDYGAFSDDCGYAQGISANRSVMTGSKARINATAQGDVADVGDVRALDCSSFAMRGGTLSEHLPRHDKMTNCLLFVHFCVINCDEL